MGVGLSSLASTDYGAAYEIALAALNVLQTVALAYLAGDRAKRNHSD